MMLTWVGDDVNVSVLYQLATVFVVSHHAASFPYSIPGGMFHLNRSRVRFGKPYHSQRVPKPARRRKPEQPSGAPVGL